MKRLAALLMAVFLVLAENPPEAEATVSPETETAAEEADPARYTLGPTVSTVVIVIVAATVFICVVPIKKKDQP